MPVYELINPSDPYTFEAPSIEVAAMAAGFISTQMGARDIVTDESTPILFGWKEWLKDRGMLDENEKVCEKWLEAHLEEIAAALDSFLIGNRSRRADVLSMLEMLPPEKRQEWRDQRQDRERTSMNKIGERAYQIAGKLRKRLQEKGKVPA